MNKEMGVGKYERETWWGKSGDKLGSCTACTVKTAVASFDGIVDLVSAGIIVDFPKASSLF